MREAEHKSLSQAVGYTTTTTDDRELESQTKLKKSHTHRQPHTHTRTHARLQVRHSTTPHTHTLFLLLSLCLCALSRSLPVDSIERERGRANGKHCAIGEILGGTLALQLAIKRQAASTLQAPRCVTAETAKQKSENRKFIANESHDKRAVHKCHFPLLLLQSQQQQQQQILTRIVVIVLGAFIVEHLEERSSPTN